MAAYFTLGKRMWNDCFSFDTTMIDMDIVYAISFLCALNTRRVLRGKGTDQEGNTNNTSNIQNTFFMVTNNGRVPRTSEFTDMTQSKVRVLT